MGQALSLREFRPLFIGRDARTTSEQLDVVNVADFGRPELLSYTLTRRSPKLREFLSSRRVALLHAHFGVEGVYAIRTAAALGIPLVTTLHGFDVTLGRKQLLRSRKSSWINYVVYRGELFAEGAKFVCVSDFVRRRAIQWGYPAERIIVSPIGVTVDHDRLIKVTSRPRIVHVARLVEVKGTATLLRALAIVKRAITGAELVIVGQGPLRAGLEELARELGVEGDVRFLGAQPHAETLRQIDAARVLCLPSETASTGAQEGLGLVLLEAAAAGKPIVGTDHGGIPEAVQDGISGYLVPERDPAALAERLITLLRDPQLCEKFGRAGHRLVTERYDLASQTARLETLYRSVL